MTAPVEKNGTKVNGALPLLWLCMAHPGGRKAGSSTYSAGLIGAAAAAGASVTVLTYGGGSPLPDITIRAAAQTKQSRWQSLTSRLPGSAWTLATADMTKQVQTLLRERRWAAAVIDHAAMGWAAPLIRRSGTPLVYVSHNHEASVRPAVAAAAHPRWKRRLLQWDAAKFVRLERQLAADAALITAITAEDASRFRQSSNNKPVLEITPGYASIPDRLSPLSHAAPRRVMLVGRYDWIAKQENLLRWAKEGVPILAGAGIETAVIGHVPTSLRNRLHGRGITFLGEQSDLGTCLSEGRLGLVAETLGGGFKMKTLDYIFHGLPIAALPGGLTGLPAEIQRNALAAETPEALARAITSAIDDLPALARMRHNAFESARHAFAWHTRGEALVAAIEEHCLRPTRCAEYIPGRC